MIIDWTNTVAPTAEHGTLASELLKFLFVNGYNDRRDMYKSNLELTKLFIEAWKDNLKVPYETLLSQIKLPPTSKKLHAGVHLTAIVLANKLIPWEKHEIKNFLTALCKIVESEHRSVYQPAAEVVGMSLHLINGHNEYAMFFGKFVSLVQKVLQNKCRADDKFSYCLEAIALHYPAIADPYLCKLIMNLYHMQGDFKTMYLRILLARSDVLKSLSEFTLLDFELLLKDISGDVHIMTLELIDRCLDYFSLTKLQSVLESVAKFTNSVNMICRELMYDIFIKIHDQYNNIIKNATWAINKLCKHVLISGLTDKSTSNQQKLLNFWSTRKLPPKLHNRLLYILDELYTPSIEQDYLGYSTYMLIDVFKDHEGFNQKLFEFPLHDCTFEEYKLYGHWRAQHASVVPLFADTLRSQNTQSEHSTTHHNININVLRATQSSLAFAPTQASVSGTLQSSAYSKVNSSLLFTFRDEAVIADETFKDPNKIDLSEKYKKTRRFQKDRSKISRHFAYEEVKKATKREAVRKNLEKEKEQGVTFYRKYRNGDFPDIQITLGDVLLPLQVLSKVSFLYTF